MFKEYYYKYNNKECCKYLNINKSDFQKYKDLYKCNKNDAFENILLMIDKDKLEEYNKNHNIEDTAKYFNISGRLIKRLLQYYNLPYTTLDKYGVTYNCMRKEARLSHGANSKPNLDFEHLLKENNINYEREFSLERYSYDFKINNFLVEINPTFTHSVDYNPFTLNHKGVDKNYHVLKVNLIIKNKYHPMFIWEWDDPEKIINCFFLPRETIYARKCEIKEVNREEAKNFINSYHVQNYIKDIIRLGLYYNKELISIMTFGKPRYNKNYQWELLRYCSSKKVIGGAEKLFKYFIKNYNPESIISYCDRSKFSGDTYIKLGFNNLKTNNPFVHWYNPNTHQHITDNLLRQRGFDQLFGTNYGKGTSNEQLMLDNGFLRVYDCGQDTYVWRKGNED